MQMAHACIRQVSAWRMRDHQIPTIFQMRQHITLYVWAWALGRQQIAGPCVMSECRESVADDA